MENRAKCDYLSLTAKVEPEVLLTVARLIHPELAVKESPNPMMRYPYHWKLTRTGQQLGVICYGADHGRNLLSLTGQAMSPVSDLDTLAHAIKDLAEPRITRVDLAVDFYAGQITYEDCEEALSKGEFRLPRTPRTASPQVKRYSVGKDSRNYGRSLYIGINPKQHRGYEKGLQIWGKLPEEIKLRYQPERITIDGAWGCPDATIPDQWFRSEVQYNNGDRFLDPAILVNRDAYYAGAYPFCAKVIEHADGVRPGFIAPPESASLLKQVLNARQSCGGLIHAVRALRPDLSPAQVLSLFDAGYIAPSLLKAGAFTAESARMLDRLLEEEKQ